ncbi:MAG: SMP-30/gluconolactonase/LRE family protein [Chloroflexota bacterium]|nr:SMP-30/gluconolactonase/LRE family protein [Chloroflexota bacterium]
MSGGLEQILETTEAECLATGFVFTEGPLWHPEGYWLFVDVRREPGAIFKLTPGGEPEIFREPSNGSNGLTFDLQGRLVMCEGDGRRMSRREPDGSIVALAEQWDGKRLNRPNDVVCKLDGSMYFTNPGGRVPAEEREIDFSGVHRIAPDGVVTAVVTDTEYPNGLAFSPDESILYVTNTRERMYIAAYDVLPDGTTANGRVFADMSSDEPDGVPDGMKVDSKGRVYSTGPGGCWVFDPDGTHVGIIRLPEIPANCAWGGEDNRTMFFTARTSVYTLRMKTTGISPWRE